jgi:chaperonin GroEL
MFPKIIKFGAEGRSKIIEGVNILANSVKSTLGPQGRNVLIGNKGAQARFTKDGVSVAKEICIEDAILDTGAQIIREVALNTCNTAGDGTTTATVIAQNIINQGMGYIDEGYNPIELRRGMEIAVEVVESVLRDHSKPIGTDEEIADIATIAVNGDRELGKIIADTFKRVGAEGVITLEESASGKTESIIVEGLQLDKGYITPYFVTNYAKMTCELENPYILVYDKKISTLQPMISLIQSIVASNDPLLIIAEDVDSEALGMLVVNKKNGFKFAAIKMPSFGNHRIDLMSDMAVMTGATVVSEDSGIKLESIRKEMLGRAKKVIISQDKTTIIGGSGDKESIEKRCSYLRDELKAADEPKVKKELEERLAKLTNGIAIIKVGGDNDLDLKERKDRVEDAVHATRAALQEGILPGGGVALLNACNYLIALNHPHDNPPSHAICNGMYLIETAIKSPWNQILENAGKIPEEIFEKLSEYASSHEGNKFNLGYDALNFKFVDMIAAGIIDPTKVVITALKDAASIAGLLLTTEVILVEENEITLDTVQGPSNSIKVRV